MFGSNVFDVIIGLMSIFLLVSMLVTIVNEMIAAALMSRAKWLRLGIEQLIGSQWMVKVYAHPLIKGTMQKNKFLVSRHGPSYIHPRSFSNVLMSVIQDESKVFTAECQDVVNMAVNLASSKGETVNSLMDNLSKIAEEKQGIKSVIAGDLIRHIENGCRLSVFAWLGEVEGVVKKLKIVNRPEVVSLIDTLEQLVADGMNLRAGIEQLHLRFNLAVATLPAGPAIIELKQELISIGNRLKEAYVISDVLADMLWFSDRISTRYMRQRLEALPNEALYIKKILLTLFDDATNDVEKLKDNIEVWFNNGMDRVSGWYKRRSQIVIAILALVMTIVMNVDAILIFRHLQTYPVVSKVIASQAMQFESTSPNSNKVDYNTAEQFKAFSEVQKALMDMSVPIGWVKEASIIKNDNAPTILLFDIETLGSLVVQHGLGWLLTALAAMLGAPFWFDMLKRVISIRGAGKPPG